jgi:hypothetical protein
VATPDIAIIDGSEVSPHAQCIYGVYCLHRDSSSGLSEVKNQIVTQYTGIPERTFFVARKELQTAGWIAIEGKSVRCLKGFDSAPSPRTPEPPPTTGEPESEGSPSAEAAAAVEQAIESAARTDAKPALSLVKSIAITSGPAPEEIKKTEPTPEIVKGPVVDEDEFQPNPVEDLYLKVFRVMLPEYWLGRFTNECPDLFILEEVWRIWEGKNWSPDNFTGQLDRYQRSVAEKAEQRAALYVGAQQKPAGPMATATARSSVPVVRSKYDETPPTDDELRESLHLPTSEDIRRMLILARDCHAKPTSETGEYLEWEERTFAEAVKYLPNIFEMTDEAFKAAIDKTVFMPIAA